MTKRQQESRNQLWKEIKIAYKYFIKPTRKSMKLQYKKPMYPFLYKGRFIDELKNNK